MPIPNPAFDLDEEPPPILMDDSPPGADNKRSTATTLVNMANDKFDLKLSDDGTVFAVPVSGVPLTYSLRGGKSSLRALLARDYFASTGKVAPQQALADAMLVLEGQGQECDPNCSISALLKTMVHCGSTSVTRRGVP